MRNKFLALVLLTIFTVIQIPASNAGQVPVLTWEQGKTESITLGGYVSQTNYRIYLTDLRNNEIAFTRSSLGKNNYYIYTINLSDKIHLGSWFIKMSDAQKTIIAGVKIIKQGIANPVQSPIKLEFVLVVLAWLISFLSVTKMRVFSVFEYFFTEKDDRGEGVLRRAYRLRRDVISSLSRSMGQLLFERESEYLFQLSSVLWVALPVLGLILGIFDASHSLVTAGILTLPANLTLLTALLGLLDPFSGFVASAGFSAFAILAGHVTSIRSLVALIVLALIWFLPTLCAARVRDCVQIAFRANQSQRTSPVIVGSAMGGLVLAALMIIFNSLLDQAAPVQGIATQLGTLYVASLYLKFMAEVKITERFVKRGKKLMKRTVDVGRVIAPRAIIVSAALLLSVVYIWTQSTTFAVEMALISFLTLGLLSIRLRPKAYIRSKILLSPIRVLVEPTLLSLVIASSFYALRNAPYLSVQKGEIYIAITLFSLLIHGVYSLIVDSTKLDLSPAQELSE
jgi:hypothetical protein